MIKSNELRERLSIDVLPNEHRQIKAYAALHGQTIRDYVLESIRERLEHEAESKQLDKLAGNLDKDPVLKELWGNEADSAYDKL